MRIAAGLPHDLWKETVEASCYLRNRTPRAPRTTNSTPNSSEDWKTPLELFTKKDQPQQHAQLKAYGCRAYAMTSNAQLGKKKRQKLDPRSHIGYLVGYNSTNIFRIWIPQRRKVISTRDVIFDEFTYFDGKFEQPQLLPSINDLIQRVEIPEDQKINQEILDEESELESVFDEDSDEEDEEEQTDPDEEDYKRKCKARLVVCGNQQERGDLPTRATTLAGMSFRALMAIAAEFDLELDQMDAVNAFVNCPLEEEAEFFYSGKPYTVYEDPLYFGNSTLPDP
ncbi:reverse transcriptase (RNA-dependent DNA polymerase) [Hirsutella rhossiliensis]|uniref:Reverse transcriptase (RNA-dependent DNA polymerase) domain-containing protein n=1 Tax=Hirsutella rhossiliensis TaxID=111463 RepID=A0A9P8N8N2_9HYPO|nr:reverse transcriptase (RNA-dependent DNA polymerase) domain-containing protein [Hirsutella rhossiliensis]KAH0968845.1 reverse transcriptase (RNA-dependent DNA polymerase) domain-containing protein [Hirsutella rhossiliensis]